MDLTEHAHAPERIASWQPLTVGPLRQASRKPWLRVRWLAVLLGAAWLVPFVLHELRLDVVQLALLLLAVASILRSGTNLVDRFALAAGLLAGVILSLGLAFSIWPWGLRPVPVGGVLFSLVALIGWAARRRPSLPRRVLGSDVLVLGSGLTAFLTAYAPVAKLSAASRFTFSATAEDRYAHFALFDTIHRLGGYTFLHPVKAAVSVAHPAEIVYPSGSHFLYAFFDTFLRSTTDPGAPLAEFNRYFIYVLVAYALLVTAIVWAARWIAGPLVTHWRRVFICSVAAALAIGGPLVLLIEHGFDSEIAGLGFVALAVAVTVRPPRVVREQVLIACALLVAVAYAYNLYAPMVVLWLGAACIIYHRRLRRYWKFTVVTVVVGCAVAFYPSTLSLASGFNAQAQSLALGTGVPVSLPVVIVLAVLIAATMASGAARRLLPSRAIAVQVVIAASVVAAFAVYQVASTGFTSYYSDKLLMAGYIVCLAGLGAVGVVLRRLPAPSRPGGRLTLVRELPPAIVAGALALTIVAVSTWGMRSAGGAEASWRRTPLGVWNSGQVTALTTSSMITLANAHLLGDHVPTLVFCSNWPLGNWRDSFLAAVFNRDLGEMKNSINGILWAKIGGPPTSRGITKQGLSLVLGVLRQSPFPLRLVVANPIFASRLEKMLAAHPEVDATVLVLPALGS